MRRILLAVLMGTCALIFSGTVLAQEADVLEVSGRELDAVESSAPLADAYYQARVIKVESQQDIDALGIAGAAAFTQQLLVEILTGPSKGKQVELRHGGLQANQKLKVSDKVVVQAPNGETDPARFYIFERYRLKALLWIGALFVGVTIVFARWRGLASLLGLSVSVGVLALYVVPRILAGQSPLLVTVVGAFFIATVALFLAHGFNRRTTVAWASTLITVVIAIVLSTSFVSFANLTGIGSEEAFFLQTSPVSGINLKGLLLSGIIIGALGVLDDITTSQAAAVHEIFRANPRLSRRELVKRGLIVGREHITSLVNTLALAYVGASLPALLLFIIYQRPFWVVLNSEAIAEEVIRTLVGSIALMCAVPITTALAVHYLPTINKDDVPISHQH